MTSHTADEVVMQFDELERFMVDVLVGFGVPREDAVVCGRVLIAADRRGMDTHGIQRLKLIYCDRIRDRILNPVTNFEVVRETPTTAVIVRRKKTFPTHILSHCLTHALARTLPGWSQWNGDGYRRTVYAHGH
jgi:LDH2 family malate/lactate/ureidoglycolate dehydrogenase